MVILTTLFLVAVAASGIARLEFSANYRIFFDEDNPQLLALEALENTYGKNENVAFLIVPDDGDAMSQDALSAAVWLTEAAWRTPYTRRVDSLANFQYTTADGDDLYVRDLVDPQELTRAEARSRIRAIALSDPRLAGSMLARNGDVSVVSVTIELPQEGLLEAVRRSCGIREIGGRAGGRTVSRHGPSRRRHGHGQPDLRGSLDQKPDDLPARKPSAHGLDPRHPQPGLGRGGGDRDGHRLFRSRVDGSGRMGRSAFFPTHLPGADHRADDRRGELRAPAGGFAAASARRRFPGTTPSSNPSDSTCIRCSWPASRRRSDS